MIDAFDVIVAGAGFTGLSAANALREAGLSVLLLEARDRVGGRVESAVNAVGERIDTGGQFLCDDMPEVMALAGRFGKTLVEPWQNGAMVDVPASRDSGFQDRIDLIRERLSSPADLSDTELGLTVGEWIACSGEHPHVQAAFRSLINGLWCQDPDRVPLWYLACNEHRYTNEVSELQYFLAETMHSLAKDLAGGLAASLKLGMPVSRISVSDRVTVEAGGRLFNSRRCLLAMPPTMANRIAIDPPPPPRLATALAAWKPGDVIKISLRYDRPAWRKQGLSGTVRWADPSGLYLCDASIGADSPTLILFVGGSAALEWSRLDEQTLRLRAVETATQGLGASASDPVAVTIRNWCGDAWSGGGYSDMILDRDARDAEAVLLEGFGPLRFASSELSPSFPGYIEGALVAGRLAAEAIVKDIGRRA